MTDIPLGEVVYFDVTTHVAGTGAISDADSTPTFAVYEEATDTDIGVGGNLTKRTSLTGNYRGSFTASTANGFEVGKWYSVIASATVSSIAAKHRAMMFRVVAAEAIAGKRKVDVDAFLGTAAATPSVAGVPVVEASGVTVDNDAIAAAVASEIIAEFKISGAAASAGASLASSDVDIYNLCLDLLKEAPITLFTDGTPEANWGLRNYTTARDAELREHPWKFALTRKRLYPTDFILDGITATLTGAWAPFRLTERWSGDLITIRRSSDDTTDDFGIGTDDGDDPIKIDAEAVSTFIGSGDGFVASLYDQSGNGNALAQATAGLQPGYTAELGDNARPVAVFDGTNDVLVTAVAMTSLMSVSTGYMVLAALVDAATLDSATTTSNHLLMGESAKTLGIYIRLGGTLYAVNNDGSLDVATSAIAALVPAVVELWHDGGVIYSRVNGMDDQSASSGDTSSLAGVLNIGDVAAGSQALDFNLFAAMTFSTIPTLAERDRVVSRLMRWAAVPGAKDFGWTYRYPVPADCLRMLPPTLDGEFEGSRIPHEIEQGYILTNQASELRVRYIQTFTDASRFDPLFKEALAARLATKGAHWFTGKMGMLDAAARAYNTAIDKAKSANALESTPSRPVANEIIDQRYDAVGVR